MTCRTGLPALTLKGNGFVWLLIACFAISLAMGVNLDVIGGNSCSGHSSCALGQMGILILLFLGPVIGFAAGLSGIAPKNATRRSSAQLSLASVVPAGVVLTATAGAMWYLGFVLVPVVYTLSFGLGIPMIEGAAYVRRWRRMRLAATMKRMTPEAEALIVSDPEVLHGQARIRGTRISVSVVLDCLGAGMTETEILRQYPTLTSEGIRAAAAYGAELARKQILTPPRVR